MSSLNRRAVLGALAMSPLAGRALAAEAAGSTVVIKDLTPKFLEFYRAAMAEKADPERRWALWQELYNFAAVPPTEEGRKMARRFLDGAWDRYPSVMARIEAGAAGMTPSPQTTLDRVTTLIRPDRPLKVTVLVYVGGLETNAFTMKGGDGLPLVAVPVEMDPHNRAPILAHELTHACQIGMGALSGGWVRSIGVTALSEGLAMRVAHQLHPDRTEAEITSHRPDWLAECESKRAQILRDVRSVARSSTSDDVFRFTIGKGPAGVEREAYYAGWIVVGYWLRSGLGFADIARIPEAEAPARIVATLDTLLA